MEIEQLIDQRKKKEILQAFETNDIEINILISMDYGKSSTKRKFIIILMQIEITYYCAFKKLENQDQSLNLVQGTT